MRNWTDTKWRLQGISLNLSLVILIFNLVTSWYSVALVLYKVTVKYKSVYHSGRKINSFTGKCFSYSLTYLQLHIAVAFFYSNGASLNSNIWKDSTQVHYILGCSASLFLSDEIHWKWIFISVYNFLQLCLKVYLVL